jgi:transposase
VIGLGSSALKIYLAVEPCDMRMGFNGLATAATEKLSQALAPDALFVFINKRHTRIKLLCFDGTGTWLATKRLASTADGLATTVTVLGRGAMAANRGRSSASLAIPEA